MYKLSNAELRLIKNYQRDIDGFIDVIKVICNDAYNTGTEDGYHTGFSDGYDECYYTNEQAKNEKQQSKYDPLMDREYNI